jgi:hypothetical protein
MNIKDAVVRMKEHVKILESLSHLDITVRGIEIPDNNFYISLIGKPCPLMRALGILQEESLEREGRAVDFSLGNPHWAYISIDSDYPDRLTLSSEETIYTAHATLKFKK